MGLIARHRVLTVVISALLVAVVLGGAVVAIGVWRSLRTDRSVPFDAGEGPGSVVEALSFSGLPLTAKLSGVKAVRMTYESTSAGNTQRTVVSGLVVFKESEPPAGGWPVVAFAHGTTGINQPCAPSSVAGMYGLGELAANLANQGFVAVLPDYQGLGASGVHPYLDAPTAGRNLIDGVRAARAIVRGVSPRFVAYGGSQGGGAVLAAATQFSTYGGGLEMLGAAALVPAADITGLAAKARAGEMTQDQQLMLQWVIESWAREDSSVDRDDYRRGAAVVGWDALSQCTQDKAERRAEISQAMGPKDIGPASGQAQTRLETLLAQRRVPIAHTSVPILLIYGGQDTFIDSEWTKSFAEKLCAAGDIMEIDYQPDRGHADVEASAALSWIGQRFAGEPATNSCE